MDSRDHVHTGIIAFVYAGLSAVVFIQLVRLGSGKLATSRTPLIASIGRASGALVQFGN